ncbi:MAG TPA: GlsB/YeaQ/YmgE family stress response membrane protein [Cryptosporangiaceae bacterium]|nr:GlsB/YeaQ/YmgE family stress response membrane protein [Cryptosporangiaceae bacterium]
MTVTGLITALIVGVIIGVIGRLVAPGRQNIPFWLTILVGIVAALLGTFVARLFGVADTAGIDWIELLFQIVIAAVGVTLAAAVYPRSRSRGSV